MRDLLIPYALGPKDAPVFPDRAFAGGDYRCPECQGRVGIRTPSEKRAHFYHLPPHGTCNLEPSDVSGEGEGRLHSIAKHTLYAWLERWITDDRTMPPRLEGICSQHGKRFLIELPRHGPFRVTREHTTPEGRRFDVAIIDASQGIALGIEIHASHRVSAEKAAALTARWVEVGAASIEKAYRKLLAGEIPPSINVLRWCKSDEPKCCKHSVSRHPFSFSPQQPFGAISNPAIFTGHKHDTNHPQAVFIPEPVKMVPEDTALLSAAGAASGNGQTPQNFANAYAKIVGLSPQKILQRLKLFGVARSDWSWS